MEYCKLQIGCILVLMYIMVIYYKEKRRFQIKDGFSLYELLMMVGFVSLILDGATAYTVNHLDTVDPTLNLILHGLFLISIDTLIFTLFLYMLAVTEGLPKDKGKFLLLCTPFVINVGAVLLFLGDLEYRTGEISNYSMGVSAYTCFSMAAVYIVLTMVITLRRWDYIQSHKRMSLVSCLVVLGAVTSYQMVFPDSLITGIGSIMIVLGAYMNQEDPAMKELSRYHDEMVMGFATLIENRDNSTGGHVKRTTQYVKLLAEELRDRGYYKEELTKDYMKNLMMAAPMHDVGKIAVPDAILQKPGRLTPEEFEQMKLHTVKGGDIIRETFSRMGNEQYMEIAYEIARHHHEKWNGKGYPDGLKRKEIPLCARIMAIADVFDAVSENRCYRAAMPLEQCFDIIEEGSGQDFDPILAEVFLDIRDKVKEIKNWN
ncbi:MAG: HD-GYP domain-containing protein [Bariatricus sp.]